LKLLSVYTVYPTHRDRARIDLNKQTAVVYRPGRQSFSKRIQGDALNNSRKPDFSSNARPVTKE
jgi:hypothetical protein